MENFETAQEWKLLAGFLDARGKRYEHAGKGLRRNLMIPKVGQPPVTLEQIAGHEARIDENAMLRRLPTMILAQWRDQIQQLYALRDRPA